MRSEFDFINNIKSRYNLSKIGDDCAVLPKDETTDLLITSDMLVEDIDFRLEWTTPDFLGHKALAVSLSDIAAMGGKPTFAMLSIGIPDSLWKTEFLECFYSGWSSLASQYGVELVGGDISRTEGKLVIDSTVLGQVARGGSRLRSKAAVGDAIFVTGYLGGAAAGLKLLESGFRYTDIIAPPVRHLLFRQLEPIPNIDTSILLQTHGLVNGMIDISDGLSSDVFHIVNASGVGCRLVADNIPVDPAIAPVFDDSGEAFDLALNGGEDFELLLTVNKENFSAVQDLGFHHIGEVTVNAGVVELIVDGKPTILEPKGYRHF